MNAAFLVVMLNPFGMEMERQKWEDIKSCDG